MNLVGGYDSSDDDDEPQQQQQQHRPQHLEVETPKSEGKALLLSTSTGTAPAQASTKQLQQPAEAASSKSKKRKGSKKGTTKKKKKSKTVNALVLSPEIQAALARGDTLGDSDSDDQDAHKKPPKFVRRPAGSDPNDLLSLLPQPSTATSADDILLKNKKRRQDASRAKSQAASPAPSGGAAANGGSGSVGGSASTDQRMARPAASETRKGEVGGSRKDQGAPSQASDSDDDDGDDLLAGMHAKSAAAGAAAAAGPDASASAGGPLFTLPSRPRPPPGSAATGLPLLDEGMEGTDTVLPDGGNAAQQHFEEEGQDESVGQQWGAAGYGHAAGFAPQAWQGGTGYGGAVGGAVVGAETGASASQHAAYGAASVQHQQAPYYHPAAAQASAGFGAATQQGASGYEAELGGGGGKATRRKGRDMERALARGDLGALGSETPVMDLHQGSNDYNPLRTKPVTAAMKQDQKHIEGSVYDPSTGQTVKTLEPTSTQKRKHQINQLAVQAASMERDLMERSGASRLTKAQTHAKYGW